MRRRIYIVAFFIWLVGAVPSLSQDPNFSQFFSSPLNINPALTARINEDWRMVSNFRNQWIGPASPYITGTISFDRKIMQHKVEGVEEEDVWGVGGMLMFDYAMYGIVKSAYASFNLSYNKLLVGGDVEHRLGGAFGVIYGNRYVDFSRLTFEEQFTGNGFNTNLPTGEQALLAMKAYFSASLGLVYSITSERSNFDLGVATFHLNRPKQTWLDDENEYLPMRSVIHANYETFINEAMVLNVNAIYQHQRKASYYSAGGALGFFIPNSPGAMLHAGAWYWSANAVTPYVGLTWGNKQFGLSYDATISKLRQAPKQANTFELSFIIRGERDPKPGVPCPWK